MKRRFTLGTAVYGMCAVLWTIWFVGTLIQVGLCDYMVVASLILVGLWWLVWTSTKPEE